MPSYTDSIYLGPRTMGKAGVKLHQQFVRRSKLKQALHEMTMGKRPVPAAAPLK
jgi:hypothetical protein